MIGNIGAVGPAGRTSPISGVEGVSSALTPAIGGAGSEGGFAAVMEQVASGVTHSLRAAERVAAHGVLGTGSVQETVEGVMAAEQSLQVGIGIRDRIVNAYLELSRMAI